MQILTGYLAAIISMLGWGSYFVPMKRVKSNNPIFYQAVMCLAIFISSCILTFFTHKFIFSWLAILSGILWAVGNFLSVLAVKHSRLSIAAPVWMATIVFVSFAWGTLFFGEKIHVINLALLGMLLLIGGLVFLSSIGGGDGKFSTKGIFFACLAGLIFGSYLVPFKLSGLDPLSFLFPMSLGIMVGGFIPFFIKIPKIEKDIFLPGLISGVIWNTANVSSFFAVSYLGIAIGFPLTQMALFVSVLWGVFYFKEIKEKTKIFKLTIAAVLLFTGAVLLVFSK